MAKYKKLTPPKTGSKITIGKKKEVIVPNDPVISFIEGDGTGPDIWKASQVVFDGAVQKAYGGTRKINWFEVYAGDKANVVYGPNTWLPEDTLKAIKEYVVAIKGPLTTPVGEGIRSINVALRQVLDLYACVRPVRWFEGVPAPVKEPGKLDIMIFRENTEDVYSGVEYISGKPETKQIISFINKINAKKGGSGKKVNIAAGIGIKPITKAGTQRLVRKAIQFAIAKGKPSVSIVHKGNIMKYTEGAFRNWGYEIAKKEFRNQIVTWDEVQKEHGGKIPAGKVLVQDVIADNMFQQLLLRPSEYSVLATPNLNGDYLSDAAAAQVGGLGIAPGANIGDKAAVFEATHGTAPKYAGQDKVNPGSVILSGVMMFEYMGWDRAAQLINAAVERTIANKTVTYDFERQMPGAKLLKCSEFGREIVKNMDAVIGSVQAKS